MSELSSSGARKLSSIDLLKWRLKVYWKSVKSFWIDFRKRKSALFGFGVIIVFILISVFPQLFTTYDPSEIFTRPLQPPSLAHLLGTDDMGRDMWTQLIYGARTSMIVGFVASFLSFLIGLVVGMVSGFKGGIVDAILMRVTDFFLSIPSLPLMVVIAFVLKPNLWNVILAITIVVWTSPVRVIRSQVLSLKERLYITRARVLGDSNTRILVRYITPSVLPIGFATMVLAMGWAIPSEAFLSWLGLGDTTHVSWGMILYYAFVRGSFSAGAWWNFVPPGLMLLIVVTAFTMVGHGMEEVLNPKLRGT